MKKTFLIAAVLAIVIVVSAGVFYLAAAPKPAKKPVLLSTGWLMSGWNAWAPIGDVKGFFDDEGISITIVRGYGGADTVGKVIAGTFEVGLVDFPTVIEAVAKDPNADIIAIFNWMDVWGPGISTLKGKGIEKPQDLAGKTCTVMVTDVGRKIFPLFAEKFGFDSKTVKEEVVSVALRVPMVIEGKANAVIGYWMSVRREFLAAGVKPEDVLQFKFSDYFPALFGEALAVRKSWLKENPDVARGLVRAVARSLVYAYKNPGEAISELLRREPLLDKVVETSYQDWIFKESGFVPTVLNKGLSHFTDENVKALIDFLVKTLGLPRTPSVGEVYTGAYLPPLADRKP